MNYLHKQKVCKNDRVIINGGEPLLYSHIQELLEALIEFKCEILIYTNGRNLSRISTEKLNGNFRFIVPIHGYKELHDEITGVFGSYIETLCGLESLVDSKCKVDIKIIINHKMIMTPKNFEQTLISFGNVKFNNAVHLTKMADTIVSRKNNCISVSNDLAAEYTKKLYEYFRYKYKIKIFDTCVKELSGFDSAQIFNTISNFEVYYKDINQDYKMILEKPFLHCMKNCDKSYYCESAVGEYKVLEFFNDRISIELE